jgi:hypothetical protein
MKADAHNPCPACAVQVRALYSAAAALAEVVASSTIDAGGDARALAEAGANVRLALQNVAPFIDAHLANQDHALSTELLDARFPKL